MRIILTGGQRGDAPQAAALLADDRPVVVMADAAYDAEHFCDAIGKAGAVAVIPNNPSREKRYPLNRQLCRERHLIECRFSELKQFRRVAIRYAWAAKRIKVARNYVTVDTLAATTLWLK